MGRKKVAPEQIISPEMARTLCELSFATGRQTGVLLARSGAVLQVIVGDPKQIVIPALAGVRAARGGRLRGIRCVHTHPGGEDLTEDDLLDLLFLRLDLMAIIKMLPDGLPERLYAAHLVPVPVNGKNWSFLKPVAPTRQEQSFAALIAALEEEFGRFRAVREVDARLDRAILVSVTPAAGARARQAARASLDELTELARSAGVAVLDTVIQLPRQINPKWLLGKGKLAEIMLSALRLNANLLIFDLELNPSQIRSITDHTELRVIDRTQLILDIFARRALSREGKLQVEMAQLKYLLPRLTRRDDALSRLTGGIGARGPGETKLEMDRRRINDRLARLARELKTVSRERQLRRRRRKQQQMPVISLIGYTNAGKSTLLNTLTHSRTTAEDKLFATLDPASRRLRFPQDMEVIVTDTVGFIRHLPAELLQAFKATLEELSEADLLVHVIDAGNPRVKEQIQVVEDLLRELDLAAIPCLRVFNKMDLAGPEAVAALVREHQGIGVSALDASTLTPLIEAAQQGLSRLKPSGLK